MAFNASIPEATDRPSQSQSQIKDNFGATSTVVAVNHVAFDDPSGNQGKHKFMQMPEEAAPPAHAANEGVLYTKQGATTAVTELTFKRESGTVIEMTATGTSGTTRWSMLPSGLLMKWGSYTSDGINNAVSITAGPNFNAVDATRSVQITGQFLPADNIIVKASNLNQSQFLLHYLTNSVANPGYTLTYSSGARTVYWTVVGLPA